MGQEIPFGRTEGAAQHTESCSFSLAAEDRSATVENAGLRAGSGDLRCPEIGSNHKTKGSNGHVHVHVHPCASILFSWHAKVQRLGFKDRNAYKLLICIVTSMFLFSPISAFPRLYHSDLPVSLTHGDRPTDRAADHDSVGRGLLAQYRPGEAQVRPGPRPGFRWQTRSVTCRVCPPGGVRRCHKSQDDRKG